MAKISVIVGQLSGNSGNSKNQSETKTNIGRTISFLTVQKMIYRFLTCDRIIKVEVKRPKYTKYELAEKLNLSEQELKKLRLPYFCRAVISKINLPLVRLYCSTKWVDDECKTK